LTNCNKEFKNWKIKLKGNRASWNRSKIRVVCTPTTVLCLQTKRSKIEACRKIQIEKVQMMPAKGKMELAAREELLKTSNMVNSKKCMDIGLKAQQFAKCWSKPALNHSPAAAQAEQESQRTGLNLFLRQTTVAL
jgi:hypothetical protein